LHHYGRANRCVALMNTRAATFKLVRRVIELIETPCDSPLYYERSQGLLEACKVALDAIAAAQAEGRETAAPPVTVFVRRDLGPRIAELAAGGLGVRAIARRRARDRARAAHDAA